MKEIKELIKDKEYLDIKRQFDEDNVFLILVDPKHERYHTRVLYHLFNNREFLRSFLERFTDLKIGSFEIISLMSEKIEDDKSNIKDISCDVRINNEKYKIIFEIKLSALETNNQTERYINEAKIEKKAKKIKDYFGFYIRLGDDIHEELNFKKIKRDELIQFLESDRQNKVIADYVSYLKLLKKIADIRENYDLSGNFPSGEHKDRHVIDYLRQFGNLSAIKSNDLNFFQRVSKDFEEYSNRHEYSCLGTDTNKAVKNSIILLWDKSWNSDRIHYEFQHKPDCLKIHIEVDKDDRRAVNERRNIYYKLQKDLEDKLSLKKYGLKTERRLNDNRSSNQLCKFSNIIINENYEKNNLFENIMNINEAVRTAIKNNPQYAKFLLKSN